MLCSSPHTPNRSNQASDVAVSPNSTFQYGSICNIEMASKLQSPLSLVKSSVMLEPTSSQLRIT